jgi:hypothetical protein
MVDLLTPLPPSYLREWRRNRLFRLHRLPLVFVGKIIVVGAVAAEESAQDVKD